MSTPSPKPGDGSVKGRAVWLALRLFIRVVQPAYFHRTFVLWAIHPNPEREGGTIQQPARVGIIHAGSLLVQPGNHLACVILIAALVLGDFYRGACIGFSVFGTRLKAGVPLIPSGPGCPRCG